MCCERCGLAVPLLDADARKKHAWTDEEGRFVQQDGLVPCSSEEAKVAEVMLS